MMFVSNCLISNSVSLTFIRKTKLILARVPLSCSNNQNYLFSWLALA
jgi:hypothetical protein